jgi:hypothetical protein
MKQTLKIEGKLFSLNNYINAERMNRYFAASIKKKETQRVYFSCKTQKIKPMDKIDEAFFYYYHDSKRGDYDGFEFYQKFIWDGLKEAGIILNDTQQYTPWIRHHIHRVGQNRLEVVLISYDGKNDSINEDVHVLQR